ncbi:MAG: alpha/beta hydrolase [Christensenellales bacterium]|jgi:putative tributyrin esterase
MALLHVDFFSETLGMSSQMDVILPQQTQGQIGMEGKGASGKFQTLYLLHGMSDDHTTWQRRTSIERYVAPLGIAVVMPTTHLGWYTDMAYGFDYWTYMTQELPKICQEFFPLSEAREDNFVAGLSMGGYGAFKMALGAPDKFCAGASLSGGLIPYHCYSDEPGADNSLWEDIFGPREGVPGSDNDLFTLVDRLAASGQEKPMLYQWCGTEDFLYQDNVQFRDFMAGKGFDYTYEQSPGVHAWEYWDEKIQTVLSWLPIKK